MLTEMVGSRSCEGRAFQDNGPDEQNARGPNVEVDERGEYKLYCNCNCHCIIILGQNSNLQGVAQLYGPVYHISFIERLTSLLSPLYIFAEISSRAVFHDQAEAVVVPEAGFVGENIGMIELTENCRFMHVVAAEILYRYFLQCILKTIQNANINVSVFRIYGQGVRFNQSM